MKSFVVAALAAVALIGTEDARAQAGTWLVKAGVNNIAPKVKSGDLSAPSLPGSKVDVDDATSAILTATYMLDDNTSLEFYAGLPYKHDILGAGALAGAGKIATVKQVSPTLFAQYRFFPAAAPIRPYVGLGLTYAYFYGEEGSAALTALTNPGGPPTRLEADSAFGISPQLGLYVTLAPRWFLDASLIKTYLKSTSTLSTGQSVEVKLNPLSTNVSIGYRF